MGTLFISHSSQNNPAAGRVRDWLKTNGWKDVFLDLDPSQGLAPGHRWQEELKKAGENCAAVIVLISPDWVASTWCQTEFLVADQLGKRIFPVLIAPTPFDSIRLELRSKFQIADISTPEAEAEGFRRLAIGLKRAGLDPTSFDWPPPGEPNRPVYRGLKALDVADAAIFFGRDAAITRGLDELRQLRGGAPQRILVILGASGAGKSSFLRAGLIARLQRDEENFLVLPIVRPGRAALTGPEGLAASLSKALGRAVTLDTPADLARAIADVRAPVMDRLKRHAVAARETWAGKPPTVIVPIDQAEELFGAENTEREAFISLLDGAMAEDSNLLVAATIRTDSYEPLQRGWMPEAQSVFTLPPLAAGAFQEVITGPARLAKPPLTVDPDLVPALLADLDEADALPLLAFTLERLASEHGKDNRLTLADYREGLGGLEGAIRSAVEAALGPSRRPETLAMARRLFVPALVQVDTDGVKRRIARRQDIPAEAADLAARFVDQRLLVSDRRSVGGIDEETLEVAHEAILRQWPALVGWIAEEKDSLRALDGVRAAAQEWTSQGGGTAARHKQAAGQAAWLVHQGDRLKTAHKLAARPDFAPLVTGPMRAYLAACTKSERKATGRRRSLQLLTASALVVVMGVGAAYMNREVLEPQWVKYTRYWGKAQKPDVLANMERGAEFQDCTKGSKDCPVMVVIPGGEFLMGEPPEPAEPIIDENGQVAGPGETPPDERPRIKVARFAVSKFEVTFDDWDRCVAGGGCKVLGAAGDEKWGRGKRPVINVSWEDAQAYATWLSGMTGARYRLLTEAEWEYAARGITSADDPRNGEDWGFGNDETLVERHAWFNANSDNQTHPVGEKDPNRLGLRDMHGNVWEWVEDCYDDYDPAKTDASPAKTDDSDAQESGTTGSCTYRVLRGGSWGDGPGLLRSASRSSYHPESRVSYIGFRLARTL